MLRASGDEVGKNVWINTTLPCSLLPGRIALAPNKDEFNDMISSKGEWRKRNRKKVELENKEIARDREALG